MIVSQLSAKISSIIQIERSMFYVAVVYIFFFFLILSKGWPVLDHKHYCYNYPSTLSKTTFSTLTDAFVLCRYKHVLTKLFPSQYSNWHGLGFNSVACKCSNSKLRKNERKKCLKMQSRRIKIQIKSHTYAIEKKNVYAFGM